MMKYLLIFLSFSLLVFPSTATASSLVKAPNNLGLVGYWPFNDGTGLKATDFSGYGNTGTLTGGPTWIGGKLGYGLRFDGTNDYVATPTISLGTTHTTSAWVKFGSSGTNMGLFSGPFADYSYQLFFYANGVYYARPGNAFTKVADYTHDVGVWHFFAMVRNGTAVSLYVDGVFLGSATLGGNEATSLGAVGVHPDAYVGGYYFLGNIDEARAYNRALGANEVARLYASGAAKVTLLGSTDGLVGYWPLNDCQRTRATDQSGRGNHGTLNGFSFTGTSSNWVTGDNAKDLCAVAFDGTDNYIDMGDPANGSLDFGTGAFTVSAWFKAPSTAKATYRTIAAKYFAPGYWIQTDANGYIVAGVSGAIELQGNRDYFDNQWHHVIYTRRGTGTNEAFLYVDGVLEATGTSSGTTSSANSLYVGSFPGLGRYWIGSIDEVRVYSRGFTAQEAKALHAGSTRKAQASAGSLTAGTSLATGLVGHWTFDGAHMTGTGGVGTAKDVSGNNNHGTLTNGPTRTLGKLGQALSFDGSNDFINAGRPAFFDESPTALTFSVWIKPTSISGYQAILGSFTGSIPYYFLGMGAFYGSPNALNVQFRNNSAVMNVSAVASSIGVGKWSHVTVVWDGSQPRLTFYVDGAQISTTTSSILASMDPLAAPRLLGVGGDGGGAATSVFPGTLDDVRIYNRALSANEVKQLYNLAR